MVLTGPMLIAVAKTVGFVLKNKQTKNPQNTMLAEIAYVLSKQVLCQ